MRFNEMISYTKDEIISVSNIVRYFGKALNNLKSNKVEKIAIIRNNKIEAVLVPLSVYEKLQEMEDMEERREIYNIVKEREKSENNTIPFDTVLKEYGINRNEL